MKCVCILYVDSSADQLHGQTTKVQLPALYVEKTRNPYMQKLL